MAVEEEDIIYTGWGKLKGWEDTSNPPYAAMKYDDSSNWQTICDDCGAVIAEDLPYRDAVYEGQKLVNKYCPSCGKYRPTFHYQQKD